MIYKGYIIKKFRKCWKIYTQGGDFKATCTRRKDAKARIDFCVKHKLWSEENG